MNVTYALEVEHLNLWDERTGRPLVRDSSFQVAQGKCLAIVGESGSGKTLTGRAIARLNVNGIGQSGNILLLGEDLSCLSEKEMRRYRGKRIYMIMQNGMSAFDPSKVIGRQLMEVLGVHFKWSRKEMQARLEEALSGVGLAQPAKTMDSYPWELSGGMLQRVMIALALVLEPDLIIADEPTTALDAVTVYDVVKQFMRMRDSLGCALIFVSHDMGVVKAIADDALVMKSGEMVEYGSVGDIFAGAGHPYTRYLVSCKETLVRRYTSLTGGISRVDR